MFPRAAPRSPAAPRHNGVGLAVLSAATFGAAGPFAKALLDTGWSPGATALVRIGGAALVLAVPTVVALRRSRPPLHSVRPVVVYGVIAVAGAQVSFFNAMQYLSVGVALLLEYLAPVLLVALAWARSGRPPGVRTVAGAGVSLVGLVLVLDIGGSVDVDIVGVAWGLAAAVCLSAYFLVSANNPEGVSPVALAGGGLVVGGIAIAALGVLGIVPLHVSADPVAVAGMMTSWVVPVMLLVGVSTVVAYLSGIHAAGRLGSRVASFIGLAEVMFAVLFAWLLLGELPAAIQLLGGVCILVGVTLVNGDREDPMTQQQPACKSPTEPLCVQPLG